jgi:hypothetical protein
MERLQRDSLGAITSNLFCWKLFLSSASPANSGKSANRSRARVAIRVQFAKCWGHARRAFNRLKPHVPISTNAPAWAGERGKAWQRDSKKEFSDRFTTFFGFQSYQGNNFRQRQNQWQKVELASMYGSRSAAFPILSADTALRTRERARTDSHTFTLFASANGQI